jgi:hypothetical protein
MIVEGTEVSLQAFATGAYRNHPWEPSSADIRPANENKVRQKNRMILDCAIVQDSLTDQGPVTSIYVPQMLVALTNHRQPPRIGGSTEDQLIIIEQRRGFSGFSVAGTRTPGFTEGCEEEVEGQDPAFVQAKRLDKDDADRRNAIVACGNRRAHAKT